MFHDHTTKPQRQDMWQLMDQDTKTALSLLTKVLCDEPHLLSWKMRRFYAKARGNPTETPFPPGSPLIGELPRARAVETQVVDHDKLLIDELDVAMGTAFMPTAPEASYYPRTPDRAERARQTDAAAPRLQTNPLPFVVIPSGAPPETTSIRSTDAGGPSSTGAPAAAPQEPSVSRRLTHEERLRQYEAQVSRDVANRDQ